tara:strand:- start:3165 stop:3656 length:492 start_codon:yes stop_codon:yes gene_type:complete
MFLQSIDRNHVSINKNINAKVGQYITIPKFGYQAIIKSIQEEDEDEDEDEDEEEDEDIQHLQIYPPIPIFILNKTKTNTKTVITINDHYNSSYLQECVIHELLCDIFLPKHAGMYFIQVKHIMQTLNTQLQILYKYEFMHFLTKYSTNTEIIKLLIVAFPFAL